MSADNGIYILKTGKQYRVAQCFAIENLYWDKKTFATSCEIQPKMIVNMFGKCPFTYDANKAINIADRMQQEANSEYGVVVINAHKSWKQILEEIKENK